MKLRPPLPLRYFDSVKRARHNDDDAAGGGGLCT